MLCHMVCLYDPSAISLSAASADILHTPQGTCEASGSSKDQTWRRRHAAKVESASGLCQVLYVSLFLCLRIRDYAELVSRFVLLD